MEYIVLNNSEEALLEQLIEESGELIQACAKRLRILRKESPTPVTIEKNKESLIEELADVSLCARAVIHKLHINSKVMIIQDEKEDRWTERLHEAKEGKK